MPRNSGGIYTLPAGNPVTSGTTISSTWANNTLNDIKSEMTNSLARNGFGGMLAPLRLPDGSNVNPALGFTNDNNTGLRLNGAGELRFVATSTDVVSVAPSEVRFFTSATVETGGITVEAGGIAVEADGISAAGGLVISSGGSSMNGTLASAGLVQGAHVVQSTGTMGTTSGNTYPLFTAKGTSFNSNSVQLTSRARNRTTVSTGWGEVDLGLSYDVDNVVAAGGSFYLGKVGATLTSGTAATGSAPAAALTLANGHLALAGTAPAKDQSVGNAVTPTNVIKAWASVSVNSSGVSTFNDGFNVASVSNPDSITKAVTITFGTAMASNKYAVDGSADFDGTSNYRTVAVRARNAGSVDVVVLAANTGTPVNLSSVAAEFNVIVVGRQ